MQLPPAHLACSIPIAKTRIGESGNKRVLEGATLSLWLAASWKRSHNAIKKTLKGQHDSLDAEPLPHVSKKNKFEKE